MYKKRMWHKNRNLWISLGFRLDHKLLFEPTYILNFFYVDGHTAENVAKSLHLGVKNPGKMCSTCGRTFTERYTNHYHVKKYHPVFFLVLFPNKMMNFIAIHRDTNSSHS